MDIARKKRIDSYYKNKIPNVEILVDNVWDPHNASAVLRSCDGFGISKVNLYYTYNQFPKLKSMGKKSSSSANKWLKIERIKNLKEFVKEKKKQRFKFMGADIQKSTNLTKFKFPPKCIICFGNENQGLSKEIKEACDSFIFIPMAGFVRSFNISVSAGVILYELFRQKGKKLKLTDLSVNRNQND
ncbi:MAG: RNA methyltransferase [Nanoarchaeota archaeon]|nr:RNA methyltransferase [Nanoarchaeota archaeon]